MMNGDAPAGLLALLARREHRWWRRAERRARRDHDTQQLATLQSLAATGGRLTRLLWQDSGGHAAAAEFMIDGRQIRAGRIHQPTLAALTQALGRTPAVPLLAASRYGPCWVLTFGLATAPLAVLADRLTILPDRHVGPDGFGAPPPPSELCTVIAPSAR